MARRRSTTRPAQPPPLYEALVQSINAIVWEVDARTLQTTFVSKHAEDILGYPVEQWKEPDFWIKHLHPDDRGHAWAAKRQLADSGSGGQFEYRMFAQDGRIVWLKDIVSMREDDSSTLRGVKVDITDRKESEERLNAMAQALRALSARLNSAIEEERTRVAREIHDQLGGGLTGLKLDLETLRRLAHERGHSPELDRFLAKVADMTTLADNMISSVRRISSELRPDMLDEFGLNEAIKAYAYEFQERTGIQCASFLDGPQLDNERATAVFRIMQEALTNTVRHAQATRVEIETRRDGPDFVLTIRDNGRGISDEQKSGRNSLGLLGIRERANLVGGSVDVFGAAGKGTVVVVRIPVEV